MLTTADTEMMGFCPTVEAFSFSAASFLPARQDVGQAFSLTSHCLVRCVGTFAWRPLLCVSLSGGYFPGGNVLLVDYSVS